MRLNDAFVEYLRDRPESGAETLWKLREELLEGMVLQPGPHRLRPLLAAPLLLDDDERDLLDRGSRALCAALPALGRLVDGLAEPLRARLVPPALRPFLTEELPLSLPVSRCDYLLGPAGWRLTEINTSASIGQLDVDEFNQRVRRHELLTRFLDGHGLSAGSPIALLAEAVLARCAELDVHGRPTVAIVDWQGYHTEYLFEHQKLAGHYSAHGLDAVVCHHRELSYRAGRLWFGRRPVHAVHREFLLEDLPADPASAYPVLRAARDGNVVLVSGFRDEWLAGKAAFALLPEAADAGLLPADAAGFVADLVPPTWLLTDDPAGHRSAMTAAQARRFAARDLVLKPVIGSGSAGVLLGATCPAEEFWAAVDRAAAPGADAHVLQDLVAPNPVEFPWLDGNDLVFSPGQPHPGVYVVDGRAGGFSTRMIRGTAPRTCSLLRGGHVGAVWSREPGRA